MAERDEAQEPSRSDILKEYGEAFTSGKPLESVPRETNAKPEADQDQNAPDGRAPVSADEAGNSRAGSADGSGKKPGEQPRGSDGKFEPFAGFSELKPEQQAFFRSLQAERDQYKRDYASMLGKVPGLQRELESLRKNMNAAPSQARDQNITANLKKFADYKQRFPEDAEAIDEYVNAVAGQYQQANKELTDKIAKLEARFAGQDEERKVAEAARITDQLDREHPSWRRIAGWEVENADGTISTRHASEAQWHPWFTTWMNNQPPEIQQDYWGKLNGRSAVLMGQVLTHFERDVQSYLNASGQQQADAPPISSQRAEALQDASPRPSSRGSEPNTRPIPPTGSGANGFDRKALWERFGKDFMAGKTF